jgi:mRNA interferase MazF
MMNCERGDLVLVPFQFSDRPVAKHRPALVISSPEYHAGRQEVVIAAVTSRIRDPLLFGDSLLEGWRQAGLPKRSVVTAILRTVKGKMVVRTLGRLPPDEVAAVDVRLREALGLRR